MESYVRFTTCRKKTNTAEEKYDSFEPERPTEEEMAEELQEQREFLRNAPKNIKPTLRTERHTKKKKDANVQRRRSVSPPKRAQFELLKLRPKF
ncbi:hypothetical protein TNIN_169071 [Trichonephila inaurata madagascariensis]|uniref:Uncharacterized protein n=1 Tax=Trichonephila inaurata madagascariensis TaxID=2747483 RepID=A0A8X6WYD9_9ARAC|nr:hypothetical protein TNIN_169071 [Trichonephila inaurata madagascariensis]